MQKVHLYIFTAAPELYLTIMCFLNCVIIPPVLQPNKCCNRRLSWHDHRLRFCCTWTLRTRHSWENTNILKSFLKRGINILSKLRIAHERRDNGDNDSNQSFVGQNTHHRFNITRFDVCNGIRCGNGSPIFDWIVLALSRLIYRKILYKLKFWSLYLPVFDLQFRLCSYKDTTIQCWFHPQRQYTSV